MPKETQRLSCCKDKEVVLQYVNKNEKDYTSSLKEIGNRFLKDRRRDHAGRAFDCSAPRINKF